jgi:hypothetical protein
MKRTLTILLLSLIGVSTYAQSDSTDLNLYTTTPVLVTEMDTMMYGDGNFESYLLDFTISDTTNFGTVAIEFSTSTDQILYRHTFTLAELQLENIIDPNWSVEINFGNFDLNDSYKVSVVIGNYIGVLEPSISKSY